MPTAYSGGQREGPQPTGHSNTRMPPPNCLVELSRVLKRSFRLDALARMGFGAIPAAAETPLEVFKPHSLPEPLSEGDGR